MLRDDPAFNGQNIYVFEYPTPILGKSFSIDQLADHMRLVLSTDGVLAHSSITFVSHSMGGLVTRAFILKYRQSVASKIRLLYFFATPTTGTPYASLAKLVSQNQQFGQLYPMSAETDNYLGTLQSGWLAANLGLKSYCGYETLPTYGFIIVDRQSATNLCTERLDPIDANHITIVKPSSVTNTSYRALKSAIQETAPSVHDHKQQSVRAGTQPGKLEKQQSSSDAQGLVVKQGEPSTPDLRARALRLSEEILQFLSERQRNAPAAIQVPSETTTSESFAATTPPYMRETLTQYTSIFEPRIISVHDELSSWGLKDSMFDATYRDVGHMYGNTDWYIKKIADTIRKLALWVPSVGLYEEVSDAKLAEMAIEEAKRMESMSQESLNSRTKENYDSTMGFFQTHFRNCCLDNVKNLRGVIVRRLGPEAFDEVEMRMFTDLMEVESFPGNQNASIAAVQNYAPKLQALGEGLLSKGMVTTIPQSSAQPEQKPNSK